MKQNILVPVFGVILVLLLAGAVALYGIPGPPDGAVQPAEGGTGVGDPVLNLQLQNLGGEPVSFADFSGTVLLITAWAEWCPSCINGMPDLQEASNAYGDQVTVLFVHRTATEPRETARSSLDRFPEERGTAITDPVLLDAQDLFYTEFFGSGMPVTLFVDDDGIIRHKKTGSLTPREIEETIQAII